MFLSTGYFVIYRRNWVQTEDHDQSHLDKIGIKHDFSFQYGNCTHRDCWIFLNMCIKKTVCIKAKAMLLLETFLMELEYSLYGYTFNIKLK